MHASIITSTSSTQPMKAWRHPAAPDTIFHGVPGEVTIGQSIADTQELIAELQREVAAVEAAERGEAA